MRCGSAREGAPAVCRCGGTTVFDGATIGQVFTGHVEMTCPIAADRQAQAKDDDRQRAGSAPLATALLTIAIWQAWLVLPTGGSTPSTHALHALLFLAGGTAARYLTPTALRAGVSLIAAGCRSVSVFNRQRGRGKCPDFDRRSRR